MVNIIPGGYTAPSPTESDRITSKTSIERRRKIAESLMAQASEYQPSAHWATAIAKGLQGLAGGYLSRKADEADAERNRRIAEAIKGGSIDSLIATGIASGDIDMGQAASLRAAQEYHKAQQEADAAQAERQQTQWGVQNRMDAARLNRPYQEGPYLITPPPVDGGSSPSAPAPPSSSLSPDMNTTGPAPGAPAMAPEPAPDQAPPAPVAGQPESDTMSLPGGYTARRTTPEKPETQMIDNVLHERQPDGTWKPAPIGQEAGAKPVNPDAKPLMPKMNEAEARRATFYPQARNANRKITANDEEAMRSAMQHYIGYMPWESGSFAESKIHKQAMQKADQFIAAANYLDSGAALGKEEWMRQYKIYFPVINDDAKTIENKRQARATKLKAIKSATGKGVSVLDKEDQAYAEADAAIKAKKDPALVKKRMEDLGYDTGGFDF